MNQLEYLGAFFEETSHKYFAGLFYARIDSNTKFVLQKEEVEAVRWVSWDDLEKDIKENSQKYLIFPEYGIMKTILEWKENHV